MEQEKHEPAKRKSYTKHQATYLAHALTLKGSAEDNISKSLASARVDMNPHQVEAALFALRSPLSHGVLLADEVGLGKTIEASLIIAQKWAERQRKILLIVPAMLRSQWSQELLEKFNLPSYVLENASYKADKKEGIANPFNQDERIIICSYEFASSKAGDLKNVQWDLVVFDEAHKLRNIWKDDGAKIAKTLQEALEGRKKILLSATPLQNSLLELYGLISVIDPHFFGSVDVFKMNYVGAHLTAQNLEELQYRLSKICHRTLRRQVQLDGDINFTKRHSLVQEFYPFDAEKELYDKLSAFLQREDLFAIRPKSAHLTTLVIRKILASSSFAISGTLEKIIKRLETRAQIDAESLDDYDNVVELFEPSLSANVQNSQNGENYGDETSNIIELFPNSSDEITLLTPNLEPLEAEIEELKGFRIIAGNIEKNAKGEALIIALNKAFEQVEKLGGQRKAVIFTESCRTQKYLKTLLKQNGYKDQIVLLNGTNKEPETVKIYQDWCQKHAGGSKISGSKTADMKAAIVEAFKDQATILISTESGSEGVNLQFCSLLINYDLPWNPQRVEQRIGRVHRYGQKCDVVVVNFLNKANKADELVFDLLDKKFKLFEGVFGASDEILGAVESDISIESRILTIYQKCRHTDEIEAEFEKLQHELDAHLTQKAQDTRKKLLEHFDEEVVARLKSRKEQIKGALDERGRKIRTFCQIMLPQAEHFADKLIHNGQHYYYHWKQAAQEDAQFLKLEHEPIVSLIEQAREDKPFAAELTFHYERYGMNLADLEPLRGKSGWLKFSKLKFDSLDNAEKLVFSTITDDGSNLDQQQCERLMLIPATCNGNVHIEPFLIEQITQIEQELTQSCFEEAQRLNDRYFNEEHEKLERWAEDSKEAINLKIKQLEKEIKEEKKQARALRMLEEKVTAQRQIKKLEKDLDKMTLEFFETRKQVYEKVEELLDEIEVKLKLSYSVEEVFTIRWNLI